MRPVRFSQIQDGRPPVHHRFLPHSSVAAYFSTSTTLACDGWECLGAFRRLSRGEFTNNGWDPLLYWQHRNVRRKVKFSRKSKMADDRLKFSFAVHSSAEASSRTSSPLDRDRVWHP